MAKSGTESAPGAPENAQWTLIRGARQLLTLRGASGPRRGSAMSDLNIITDGAVLIRDGVIEEVGTSRRVENLAPARRAREFDASGKVVMPAFVDPDIAIAPAGYGGNAPDSVERDIRLMSRRRLETIARATAADLVRYGVLTVGAQTLNAPDLKNTIKALRMHRAMESKPVRIRSVFAPRGEAGGDKAGRAADIRGLWDPEHERITGNDRFQRIRETWMPSIFRKKLSALMEVHVASGRIEEARAMASAAAATGFSIRLRVSGPTNADILEFACSAGAVALICSIPTIGDATHALADIGCVNIVLGTRMLSGNCISRRSAIDDGIPIALASGYRRDGVASLNPQFLLFMACHALGMTVEEAIVAATYNAACSLRLSHVTGSLAPGKAADICVMDIDDYHELARRAGHHDVALVMRAGKVVYRRPMLTSD